MALVLKDRVKEQTTTTGTGSVTLGGAVSGFEAFSAVGDGNTTYYAIVHQTADEWEVGLGTYTAAGTLLSRDTILESSNSDASVNFTAGTKDVFVTYPSDKAVYADAAGEVSVTRATSATFATSATEAATAIFATSATNATFAVSATRSTSATFAVSASLAAFAASATNATTAVSATNATSATFATSATNATTAINVDGGTVSATDGTFNTVDINGGTIDGTVIGGSSAAAGTFTDIVASGNISGPANLTIQNSGGGGSYIELVANGQKQFDAYTYGGTTVNWVRATGGQTASPVLLSAEGSDTHVGIEIKTKGAEHVRVYTNASERMRITSAGNVGIGTSSPAQELHVVGKTRIQRSTNANLEITSDNNTGVNPFLVGSNSDTFYIKNQAASGFGTGGDFIQYSESGSLRLMGTNYIDSSGNVGIGVSTIDTALGTKLHVAGAIRTDTGSASANPTIVFDHDNFADADANYIMLDRTSEAMRFNVNASERMRINNVGSVGIGNTAPSYLLDLYRSASTVVRIRNSAATGGTPSSTHGEFVIESTDANMGMQFLGSTTANQRILFGDTDSGGSGQVIYDHTSNYMALSTNGSEAVRIDSSNNVGIGTTSPDGKLNVQRTAASAGWIINGQTVGVANDSGLYMDASNNIELAVRDGSGTFTGAVRSSGVTFFNGGNVGIGTSSPGAELDIESTSPEIHLNDSDGVLGAAVTSRMIFQANGSSQGRVGFGTTAGNMALTNLQGNLFIQADTNNAQANSYITFSVDNSSKMRITSAGNVGIGTTAPAKQLHITKSAKADIGTLTDGATITPNFDANQNFSVTLGGNRTLANPSNIDPGQTGSIFVVQDGTGGRTLSFGSYWRFAGGTAPTISTDASAVDRIDYVVYTSIAIHAVATLNLS